MAVEIFRFREPGRYTVEVRIEEATQTKTFEKSEADFTDDRTEIITYEVTGDASIDVTESGDS